MVLVESTAINKDEYNSFIEYDTGPCPACGRLGYDFSTHTSYRHWLPKDRPLTLSVINKCLDDCIRWNLSNNNIVPYGVPRLIKESLELLRQLPSGVKHSQAWVDARRKVHTLQTMIDPRI